jgi:hypothetical protein
MGLALCDELLDRGAGQAGQLDRQTGTYTGDTFLDTIFAHLAPDAAEPGNTLGDEALAQRLAHTGDYLRQLALDGQIRPEDVSAIMAAVDLSPLGTSAEPRLSAGEHPEQQPILQPGASVAIAGTLF